MRPEREYNDDRIARHYKVEAAPYRFRPTKELIKFASWFSQNYKTLATGIYFSQNKKYKIKYLPKITSFLSGKHLKTGVMGGNESKIIQADKSVLSSPEIAPGFVFFLILWATVIVDIQGEYQRADRLVSRYCIKNQTRRVSAGAIVRGFNKLFVDRNSQQIERLKAISKIYGKEK